MRLVCFFFALVGLAAAMEQPATPTLCTNANKGRCECANLEPPPGHQPLKGISQTYTWYIDGSQQPFYSCNATAEIVSRHSTDRFGIAMAYLSTPGGAWSWNTTTVNDAHPRPCSADVAGQDYTYIKDALAFLETQPFYDKTRVYSHGFSQNGMGSAYVGRCFASQVTGSWMGGGGLFSPGHGPVPPNKAGTCADGCKYWPVFPCHSGNQAATVQACIQFYSNDRVTVDQTDPAPPTPRTKGHGLYLFDRLESEGNDGRMLEFYPDEAAGIKGGHSGPQNEWDWVVGCFGGLSPRCSPTCETALTACVKAGVAEAAGAAEAYATCITQTLVGNGKCAAGCTPTLAMLQTSEKPLLNLTTASSGNGTAGGGFGQPARVNPEPPRPTSSICEDDEAPTPAPPPTPPTPPPPTPPPTPPTPPAPGPGPAPGPIPAECLAADRKVCPGLEGKGPPCDACLKQHQFDKALEVPCNQHEHVKWKDNVLGYCGSISDEESAMAITYEESDATYYEE